MDNAKFRYDLDYKQYKDFLKTLKQLGKEADLTEEQIEQLGNNAEKSFKGLNKEASKTPKKFNGIQGAASKLGPALLATFSVQLLKEFAEGLLNVEREFKGMTRQIQRFTQQTTVQSEKTGVKVKALANTFKKDVNDVLIATNALSKQMGISFDDAFELIKKGFIQGADVQGDFLDKVKEYPVQFKNAGFSAEEFIKLATQEANGGIFSDKLLDTIKELDLSLKEMTKAQEDALRKAFGDQFTNKFIRDLKTGAISTKEAFLLIQVEAKKLGLNVQQTQTLTADLFKGAGEDAGGFKTVIEEVNKALVINLDETDKLGKAQARNLIVQEEYNAALSRLSIDLEGAGESVNIFFVKALTVGAQALSNLIEYFNIADAKSRRFARDIAEQYSDQTDEQIKKQIANSEAIVANRKEWLKELEAVGNAEKLWNEVNGASNIPEEDIATHTITIELLKEELAVRERNAAVEAKLAAEKAAREKHQAELLAKLKNGNLLLSIKEQEEADKKAKEAEKLAKKLATEQAKQDKERKARLEELNALEEKLGITRATLIDGIPEQTKVIIKSVEETKPLYDGINEFATEAGDSIAAMARSAGDLFEVDFLGDVGGLIAQIGRLVAVLTSKAIAEQAALKFPANIPAIAATAGAVISTISAIKNVSKFAEGTPYVQGAGTGTSDSIPARLSKGERVVTAANNQKYYPVYELMRKEAVNPQTALQALEIAKSPLSYAQRQGLALGQQQTKTGNTAVVEKAGGDRDPVNIHIQVSDNEIEVRRKNAKIKRLGKRYSIKDL